MPATDLQQSFAERRVLVTGGTRGIAGQSAVDLLARGATVCVGHSEEHDAIAGFAGSAKAFVDGIAAKGGRVFAIDQDMGAPDAGTALAEHALTIYRPFTALSCRRLSRSKSHWRCKPPPTLICSFASI